MAKKIPFLEKGVRTQILFVHKDGEVENQSASIRPSKAYERKEPAPYNAPEYSSPPRKVSFVPLIVVACSLDAKLVAKLSDVFIC